MKSLTDQFVQAVVLNPYIQMIIRNDNLGVPAVALPLLLLANISQASPLQLSQTASQPVQTATTLVVEPSPEMRTHLNEVMRRFKL